MGDIDLLEYGNAKVDAGQPVYNYAVAFDIANREPLETSSRSLDEILSFINTPAEGVREGEARV